MVRTFARGYARLSRFRRGVDFRALRPPRAELLGYLRVAEDPKPDRLPEPPRLPQRAAIYIAPDGTVHFGALFEGLVPVARALGRENEKEKEKENENE